MYKMAVIDIDGTLAGKTGDISRENIEAIKRARDKGYIVTLCTGRNITKTIPVAKKTDTKVPFACIDGTLLYNISDNKITNDLQITLEEKNFILEIAKNEPIMIEISDGFKYHKYFRNKEYYKYDIFNKHTFTGFIKSYFGGIRYYNNFDKILNIREPLYQVVLGGEKEVIKNICEKIQKSNIEDIEIRDNLWDSYAFIHRKGVRKERGVFELCNYFGISPDEVIAIGDDMNDIDMLKSVGLGVVMENAKEKVKQYADEIAPSNDKNGVAYILNKYFV